MLSGKSDAWGLTVSRSNVERVFYNTRTRQTRVYCKLQQPCSPVKAKLHNDFYNFCINIVAGFLS